MEPKQRGHKIKKRKKISLNTSTSTLDALTKLQASTRQTKQKWKQPLSMKTKYVYGIPLVLILAVVLVVSAGDWGHINTSQTYSEFDNTEVLNNKIATMYKSLTCGCCGNWLEYMQTNTNLEFIIQDISDITNIKMQYEVPQELYSCHTTLIENYVIEGHVPYQAIVKLFSEKISIKGIAVAGMPGGSPGMGEDGSPFTVSRFDAQGNVNSFMQF